MTIKRCSLQKMVITMIVIVIGACTVDLREIRTVGIQVQIHFKGVHSNVTANWTGVMTSSRWAEDVIGSPQTAASGSLPGIGDVLPPHYEVFEPVENLHPGKWNIEVDAFAGNTQIIDVDCPGLDIGNDNLAQLAVYTVRIIEDSDECILAVGGLDPPTSTLRDVETLSISAPTAVDIGDSADVVVEIANNSDVDENIGVQLHAMPPGGGAGFVIDDTSRIVPVGGTATVDFSWDTTCVAPEGDFLLTATVSAPNDTTANNSESAVVQLNADRELVLANLVNVNDPGATTVTPQVGGILFTADLINANSVPEEAIDVVFADNTADSPGNVQWLTPSPHGLACGETRQLAFSYFPPTITTGDPHDLTLTITNSIPGDDPTDNTISVTVTVTP